MAKSLGHVVSLCGHILAEISADFFLSVTSILGCMAVSCSLLAVLRQFVYSGTKRQCRGCYRHSICLLVVMPQNSLALKIADQLIYDIPVDLLLASLYPAMIHCQLFCSFIVLRYISP